MKVISYWVVLGLSILPLASYANTIDFQTLVFSSAIASTECCAP